MGTTETAVEIVRTVFDNLNRRDDSWVSDFCAEDMILAAPAGMVYQGRDAVIEQAKQLNTEIPDYVFEIVDILPGETKVGAEYILTGTNTGEFDLGPAFGKVSPRGKQMSAQGFWVFTFKDGKITRLVQYSDFYGLLTQLGLVPSAPALAPI